MSYISRKNFKKFLMLLFICVILTTTVFIFESQKCDTSEAGYIIKTTIESSFRYEIDGDTACPVFIDKYFYTILVDDNYIKIEVPYQVYTEHHLGDHFTVIRRHNDILKKYWDYKVNILDIDVPAVIVNDEYR